MDNELFTNLSPGIELIGLLLRVTDLNMEEYFPEHSFDSYHSILFRGKYYFYDCFRFVKSIENTMAGVRRN